MRKPRTNREALALARRQNNNPAMREDMYTYQQVEEKDGKVHVYTTYNCDRILEMNRQQRNMGKNILKNRRGNIKPIAQPIGRIPIIELLKFPYGQAYEYMNDPDYIVKLLKEHPEWRTCEGEI